MQAIEKSLETLTSLVTTLLVAKQTKGHSDMVSNVMTVHTSVPEQSTVPSVPEHSTVPSDQKGSRKRSLAFGSGSDGDGEHNLSLITTIKFILVWYDGVVHSRL